MIRSSNPLHRSAAWVACAVAAGSLALAQSDCALQLASLSSNDVQGYGADASPGISPDGRFLLFFSTADNVVANDTNGVGDLFLRDLYLGTSERISVSSAGAQGNAVSGGSLGPPSAITADHRFVAFASLASNLVAGDTNADFDVFVRDRVAANTQRVSVLTGGAQAPLPSRAAHPSITDDGRYVAFSGRSFAGEGPTFAWFAYVHDRQLGTTVRVSSTPAGGVPNNTSSFSTIARDGSVVAFSSVASDLVAGDTNNRPDVFVWERATNTVERVNLGNLGQQANCPFSNCAETPPALSRDGRFVAFTDSGSVFGVPATFAAQVYVRDRVLGTTQHASVQTNGGPTQSLCSNVALSGDGARVAFDSGSSELVAGDLGWNDVFVVELASGAVSRISQRADGTGGSGDSSRGALSHDGRANAFLSDAPDLVAADINNGADVFARECSVAPAVYCTGKVNSQGCQASIGASAPPSASAAAPCWITSSDVLNQRSGIFFYGFVPAARPLAHGLLCFVPRRRVVLASSGGNSGVDDCSGTFAVDLNARIQSGVDPLLAVGATAGCQFWYRDPAGAGAPSALSAALRFQVWP